MISLFRFLFSPSPSFQSFTAIFITAFYIMFTSSVSLSLCKASTRTEAMDPQEGEDSAENLSPFFNTTFSHGILGNKY